MADDANPHDAIPGDENPGDAIPGDGNPGDGNPGDAIPGDGNPGDAGELAAGDPDGASASDPGTRRLRRSQLRPLDGAVLARVAVYLEQAARVARGIDCFDDVYFCIVGPAKRVTFGNAS